MAKITYVPTRTEGKPTHITMERLAEILDSTPQEIEANLKRKLGESMWTYGIPFAEGIQCPFGELDLMNDTCYLGDGFHRCPYFQCYVHDGEHKGDRKSVV